jgi:hypothetical protein
MTRLEAYGQTDMEVRSYQKLQEAQMASTIMEYLKGIQMAKEAIASGKNGLGNLTIKYEYFTRADDLYTRYDMYSNALWRQYY